MGKRITLADLTGETTEVDLFGHLYTVRQVTRSVQKKLEATDKKLVAALKSDDGDKVIDAIIGGLDALLEPAEKSPAVGESLKDAWKNDRLSLNEINRLYESIQETAADDRPT